MRCSHVLGLREGSLRPLGIANLATCFLHVFRCLFLTSSQVGLFHFQSSHVITVEVHADITQISRSFVFVPAYSCFRNMRG